MASLARGESNTTSVLNWFILVNGVKTDAYEVGYRIIDITGGLPGTQVFPTTEGEYEDVSSLPGHFAVGSYYAYDNTESKGWTPSIAEPIGTHRIEWRWKITAAAPYQSGQEDFEVLVQSAGSSVDTYISIQDIRDQGLLEADYDDETVLAAIEMWQAFIDRACRQWFNPRSLILSVDGTDSDTLHFGVPIISISYIKINDSTTELDTSLYKVYNRLNDFSDRWNPRIKLVNSLEYTDIFTAPITGRSLIFRKGRQNQVISGVFGYVEDDNSPPKLIQRALTKLVIEKLTTPLYSTSGFSTGTIPPILGNILEEWTDGHKIKYSAPGGTTKPIAQGLRGITNDPEILNILKLYKAPIGCATQANPSYR
jgi:hypothetical protein